MMKTPSTDSECLNSEKLKQILALVMNMRKDFNNMALRLERIDRVLELYNMDSDSCCSDDESPDAECCPKNPMTESICVVPENKTEECTDC